MSLAEYVVSMAIGAIVLLVVVSLSLYSGRSFASLANYAALNSESVVALDLMTRDIRQAVSLAGFSTNELVFNDGTSKPPLYFRYIPAERRLVRQQGNETKTLLRECDALTFSIFQRTPVPGTYDQYNAANINNCKVVGVKWSCSRKIFGAKMNTDEGQMAKIVIRKK
jgi:Tfp pilus assembly protein PilW